ncbi:hypothetical protein [Nocardioides sp. SYSU DS0663]|uniref:hypothetical protein n=1 Tax=Nocardioides sp. SYSU DS0663 TaxID=3416445 RepID=UPI003F4B5FCC
MSTDKVLLRVALVVALALGVPSMVLGYSGNQGLASIGNVLLLLALLLALPIAAAGVIVRVARRSRRSPS